MISRFARTNIYAPLDGDSPNVDINSNYVGDTNTTASVGAGVTDTASGSDLISVKGRRGLDMSTDGVIAGCQQAPADVVYKLGGGYIDAVPDQKYPKPTIILSSVQPSVRSSSNIYLNTQPLGVDVVPAVGGQSATDDSTTVIDTLDLQNNPNTSGIHQPETIASMLAPSTGALVTQKLTELPAQPHAPDGGTVNVNTGQLQLIQPYGSSGVRLNAQGNVVPLDITATDTIANAQKQSPDLLATIKGNWVTIVIGILVIVIAHYFTKGE